MAPPLFHSIWKNQSCDTQLVIKLHDLTKAVDKEENVDVIFLDYTKAFDSVPHHLLINKLKYYVISDQLILWISFFLMGRSQRMVFEGQISPTAAVKSAFPVVPFVYQRSIGETVINIKTFCRQLRAIQKYFVTIRFQSPSRRPGQVDRMAEWMANAVQSHQMLRNACPSHATVNNEICTLYLGVYLQDDLGWSTHVGHAT